jgi:hypothetical protein
MTAPPRGAWTARSRLGGAPTRRGHASVPADHGFRPGAGASGFRRRAARHRPGALRRSGRAAAAPAGGRGFRHRLPRAAADHPSLPPGRGSLAPAAGPGPCLRGGTAAEPGPPRLDRAGAAGDAGVPRRCGPDAGRGGCGPAVPGRRCPSRRCPVAGAPVADAPVAGARSPIRGSPMPRSPCPGRRCAGRQSASHRTPFGGSRGDGPGGPIALAAPQRGVAKAEDAGSRRGPTWRMLAQVCGMAILVLGAGAGVAQYPGPG